MLLSAPSALAVPSAQPSDDPCKDALDAEQRGGVVCRSPGALDPSAVVDADAIPPPPPPLRDPALFSSEIGFFAVVTAAAGVSAVAAAVFTENPRNDATSETLRQGSFYAGLGGLGLATGLGAAAVATAVFDVSTGALRLPLFDGEPQ
jgi:hypothetical protein